MPSIPRANGESVIVAETTLYRKQGDKARRFRIAIHRPERDPRHTFDFRCRIDLTGEKPRFSHGIDTFQALNLAFVCLRGAVADLVKRRCAFYFDRQLKHRYDVQTLIFNDMSFYEKLGKQMTAKKMAQWKPREKKQQRRKPHA